MSAMSAMSAMPAMPATQREAVMAGVAAEGRWLIWGYDLTKTPE